MGRLLFLSLQVLRYIGLGLQVAETPAPSVGNFKGFPLAWMILVAAIPWPINLKFTSPMGT